MLQTASARVREERKELLAGLGVTTDADRVPMTVKQGYPTVTKSSEGAGSP